MENNQQKGHTGNDPEAQAIGNVTSNSSAAPQAGAAAQDRFTEKEPVGERHSESSKPEEGTNETLGTP